MIVACETCPNNRYYGIIKCTYYVEFWKHDMESTYVVLNALKFIFDVGRYHENINIIFSPNQVAFYILSWYFECGFRGTKLKKMLIVNVHHEIP